MKPTSLLLFTLSNSSFAYPQWQNNTTTSTSITFAPGLVCGGNTIYPSSPSHMAFTYTASKTSSAPELGTTSLLTSDSECSSHSPCEGDITHYSAGVGACGVNSNGDAEKLVALPYRLMGLKSNGNPFCNKTITITCIANNKTTSATVADKCMGCDDFSIDLSIAAFRDLSDLSVGRTRATWYFNN